MTEKKERTIKNGLETISYCAPRLQSFLPEETKSLSEETKSLTSLYSFKKLTKAPAGSGKHKNTKETLYEIVKKD